MRPTRLWPRQTRKSQAVFVSTRLILFFHRGRPWSTIWHYMNAGAPCHWDRPLNNTTPMCACCLWHGESDPVNYRIELIRRPHPDGDYELCQACRAARDLQSIAAWFRTYDHADARQRFRSEVPPTLCRTAFQKYGGIRHRILSYLQGAVLQRNELLVLTVMLKMHTSFDHLHCTAGGVDIYRHRGAAELHASK